MNPKDNLDLAIVMSSRIKKIPEEAGFRCSCGRAYYAAFTYARDALASASIGMNNTGKDHARVPLLLRKSTSTDIRTAATLLEQLRVTRNSADYEVGLVPVRAGQSFGTTRAATAAILARTIIDEIDRVTATDKRLLIPAGVS